MLTTGYSPLTRIARRIPWATSRLRERLCTFAIFALLPTVVFWTWFLLQGRHGIRDGYQNLTPAMPVTSLWITLGPMFMQRGEFALERLLATLNATSSTQNWDVQGIRQAMDRVDRRYFGITLPVAFAAVLSVWLGSGAIASIVEVRGFAAELGGVVVISGAGFASASGVWGCYKAAATRITVSEWLPFRSRRPNGMQALHEFCWSTALTFSGGSLSLPTLFVVQARLPPVTRSIVLVFVFLLALGGLVLFTVPIRWLRKFGEAQKDRLLDDLASPIERGQMAVLHQNHYSVVELRRREHALNMALRLRAEINALNPTPLPQLVTRGATTLVLPIARTSIF